MPTTKPLPLEEAKAPTSYTDAQTLHDSLEEAKLAVMADCEFVLRTIPDKNAGINYRYVSEKELIRVLRPAMLKHGLALRPTSVVQLSADSWTTKSGGVSHRLRITVTYKLTALLKSGKVEEQEIMTVGEGADTGDKAAGKTMTSAYKYALRETFMIESTDDPDQWASQEVVSQASSIDQTLKESFFRFEGAVMSAKTVEDLEKFKARYEAKGFDKVHLDKLNEHYEKRLASLTEAS